MQILQTSRPDAPVLVECRKRHWWLRGVDDSRVAHPADADTFIAALLDLQPADPRAGSCTGMRVFTPPDVVHSVTRGPRRLSPRAWAHGLGRLAARPPGDDLLAPWPTPALARHAFQLVPTMALLSGRVRRVLLADDVGMGKTVQAALAVREVQARMAAARVLVIVPAGLLTQWDEELESRVGIRATRLDSRLLGDRTHERPGAAPALPGETCLMSIDTLRLPEVTALIVRCAWHLLVVDEAHQLAGGQVRRSAVNRIAACASRLLLLTATPFSGTDAQDRQLLDTGRRTGQDDRILVIARGAGVVARPPLRQRVAWTRATTAERAVHHHLDAYVARAAADDRGDGGQLAALLLRRRACSSTHALVVSLVRRLDVLGLAPTSGDCQPSLPLDDELEADDTWIRQPAWHDVAAERLTLHAVLAAARACDDEGSKVRWLGRYLRRCREPVLVFTEYADTLRAVRRALGHHRRTTCLFGAQTDEQRRQSMDAFRHGDADLLLATDAAAEGLNLHERCRLVVHLDVPWSPRRLAQRNGRLDRLGQRRPVRSTLLAARQTADLHVLQTLQARRARLADTGSHRHADLAVTASARREQLALAMARACEHAGTGRSLKARAHTWTTVSRARGRRVARRLGLPGHHARIVAARVGVTGSHPLVRPARWVAWSDGLPGHASDDGWTSLSDVAMVRRFMRRADLRSRLLAVQDMSAIGAAATEPPPDLFGRAHPVTRELHGTPAVDIQLQLLALEVLSWPR